MAVLPCPGVFAWCGWRGRRSCSTPCRRGRRTIYFFGTRGTQTSQYNFVNINSNILIIICSIIRKNQWGILSSLARSQPSSSARGSNTPAPTARRSRASGSSQSSLLVEAKEPEDHFVRSCQDGWRECRRYLGWRVGVGGCNYHGHFIYLSCFLWVRGWLWSSSFALS